MDFIECYEYEDKTILKIYKVRKALEKSNIPNIVPTLNTKVTLNEVIIEPNSSTSTNANTSLTEVGKYRFRRPSPEASLQMRQSSSFSRKLLNYL
ncbi:hypothetical protein NPIL_379111 [Nephila pilipes]|uniref:Uncharacterized protein n=1 Tax=Nephila pilipes TaxID=299642 RepID=A0A8X6MYY1_NEPPI|nr:hypothetical protein NPIL_379111 [Nephila pilipes]